MVTLETVGVTIGEVVYHRSEKKLAAHIFVGSRGADSTAFWIGEFAFAGAFPNHSSCSVTTLSSPPEPPPKPVPAPAAAVHAGAPRVVLATAKPGELLFDFDNPRLVDGQGLQPRTETDMVEWLWKQADVAELVGSIAESGWMPFDDMVAVSAPEGKYRVLEGNRRLAALKLFTTPALAERLQIKLPAMTAEHRATLDNVPIKIVASEADARAYIGFKHINGPHKWDAYAKAKFATTWLDRAGDLGEIARTLGDTHNTVRRLVIGYRVLEQAKAGGFKTENANSPRGFAFSHLYTALGQTGYQSYLGIDYNNDAIIKSRAPVPLDKVENLKDVMNWLYGDKSQKIHPVIKSQNPNLTQLNQILNKPTALMMLKSSGDFEKAFEEVESKSARFVHALVNAYQAADSALGLSSSYDGLDESVKETSTGLSSTAETLLGVVTRKIEQANKAKKTP